MSQVINLLQHALEQFVTMGHTSDVHQNYYKLPNNIYHTSKISKLLILLEKGNTSEYKGKSLEEIDINTDLNGRMKIIKEDMIQKFSTQLDSLWRKLQIFPATKEM